MLLILWIWLAFVIYFTIVFFSFINKVWKIIFSLLFSCSSKAVEEARQEQERIETQWFSFSPYARSYTDAPHFCGKSRANVQLPRKNCCTFDLMFVLYFLWPFRLRLLRHRCCPNITVPLCRAGHSFNEKHTHFRPEEKEFARQGIAIPFWWTSPNNQAPRNLIPLKVQFTT